MTSNKIGQAVKAFPAVRTEDYPILTDVSERGIFLLEVQTWYLHVPKTAAREAMECNRYFLAAVRHE